MKCVLCLVLFASSLSQSVRHDESTPVNGAWWVMQQASEQAAMDSTLAALKEEGASQSRLSQQLAHVMMRLAENDRRPPWPLVADFADEFTRELIGRQLNSSQIAAMRECLAEAMRRTGTSNARLASRLQETLVGIGIGSWKTQRILRDFIKLREAVQGPDDAPASLHFAFPH